MGRHAGWMAPPAACLFDLDGLLLDTEPLHGQAWREAAARFGLLLADEQLLMLRGRRRQDCARDVRAWILAAGGHCQDIESLLAVRQPIAEALMPRAHAMPGAENLVRRCHQRGVPMALATSSSGRSLAIKAAPHPWLELIPTRVHGDDPELTAGKPAPDGFLLAARRLGVDPRHCWAFEDSAAGAEAAAAAGCRVFVLAGVQAPTARFPEGCHRLERLDQVPLLGEPLASPAVNRGG